MKKRWAPAARAVVLLCACVCLAVEAGPAPVGPSQARALRFVVAGYLEASVSWGVSASETHAFVSSIRESCGRVLVVDVSHPAQPVVLGETPAQCGLTPGEVKPFRVGGRTYLAVGLYGGTWGGLKVFDVTDPTQPDEVSAFETPQGVVKGVTYLEVVQHKSRRILALLAAPGTEARTSGEGSAPGTGDLMILDLTQPSRPVLLGEWGVIDEPALGLEFYRHGGRGGSAKPFLENLWVSPDGTTAYLAYGDFGAMVLDIGDPSRPKLLGRVGFAAGEEGDAFDVRAARAGTLLLRTTRVGNPFHVEVSSNVYGGIREGGTRGSLFWDLPDRTLSGEVVARGNGCGSVEAAFGKVVVLQRDGCTVAAKVANAEAAGAIGVVLYDSAPNAAYDFQGPMGAQTVDTLPTIGVGQNTGLCLAQARDDEGVLLADDCADVGNAAVTIDATAVFTGYGSLDIFDIRNPARPVKLATFTTPNAMDVDLALSEPIPPCPGHVEVAENTAYVSWSADMLRVVDLSNPRAPREIGAWTGEGAPPGSVGSRAFELKLHNGLVLLNTGPYGLVILQRR